LKGVPLRSSPSWKSPAGASPRPRSKLRFGAVHRRPATDSPHLVHCSLRRSSASERDHDLAGFGGHLRRHRSRR
jgi:hypothetical protein